MDFVVTWVDDRDPEWLEQYYKYKGVENPVEQNARFRSWDNFHYWFRGIEQFAPWVNKVHLVTWGHVPKWLNTSHPKLNVVKHSDFIPTQYLPTFNTRTIELNSHLIENLAEEYVVFNDDVFIIDSVSEEMFFVDGKPCDMAIVKPFYISEYARTMFNDLVVINRNFDLKKQVKKNKAKWFNYKYGKGNISNLLFYILYRSGHFSFKNYHIALPSKKSTLEALWKKEFEVMNHSCSFTFRNPDSVNNDLQRYWDLASNNFHPYNVEKNGSYFAATSKSVESIVNFISKKQKPIICINDTEFVGDFNFVKEEINKELDIILSEKSSFER